MFKPVNRYILINLPSPTQNITESGIMLPDDFKPQEERYVTAEVVAWAPDVRFKEDLQMGTKIIVDKPMVEEINMKNGSINIVLDNYIIGIVEN
jgi:co-chaperonin GroES (HSP10)